DTGSDVSIISRRLVEPLRKVIKMENGYFSYPTGEIVPIQSKVVFTAGLGKFVSTLLMFVADINHECILGEDFPSTTDAESSLRSVLG
ncbi:hypothetical protein EAI_16834, partial [Harpegnathos saltator]